MSSSTGFTSALLTSLPHASTPAQADEPADAKSTRPPLRMRHPNVEASDSDSGDNEYDSDGSETAVDEVIPDNYVKKVLAKERPLPPITLKNWYKEINIVSTLALTVVPMLAIYGAFTTPILAKTVAWSIVYYFMTGLGITAGYHRLWAHRSYTASLPLQYILAAWGSGAVEGSIKWWARGHRAHHRYTDTDLDPYSAHKGLLWSHVGWMVVKPRRKPGAADVSDLSRNRVVQWQHKFYLPLIVGMGFILPTLVAGLGWGDYRGGFFFAGAARLLFVHHSTFCVNSLAHWLGESPFDDKHSPRDHLLTALVTIGEGYHNFHHEFPSDFRNAITRFGYDPTKWFIYSTYLLGLSSGLQTFPDNEVKRGQMAMQLKKIQAQGERIAWPKTSSELPVLTWDEFAEQSKTRPLVVIAGFIHDVSQFMDEHPGGRGIIKARVGKDATTAFFGGVYDHSNAANNTLQMLRVGCIEGGMEIESLKAYSQLIEDLRISGAEGCAGKSADVGKGVVRPVVAIKGAPEQKDASLLSEPVEAPQFGHMRLTGGL